MMKLATSLIPIYTLLFGCNQIEPPRIAVNHSDAFASVNTGVTDGTSRSTVIQIMGKPSKIEVISLAGVSTENLIYEDSKSRYEVRLINDRAVFKAASAKTIAP
jgi:hypothetical protein